MDALILGLLCLRTQELYNGPVDFLSQNKALHMPPLYWLCYRHNNQISVVIEPGASLIHARMRAALANLDEGEFTEGHELDRKWRVPKAMIGRRLSQGGTEEVVG
jgi:hypothetical protein